MAEDGKISPAGRSDPAATAAELARYAAALRESEEQYRSLVDNVNIGVYRNTPGRHGRFLRANPAIVEMFGYASEEEFRKVSVSELYQDPEDRQRFVEEVLSRGAVKNREIRLRRKDGSAFWGAVTARVARDADGTVKWMDGVIEDVTERKLNEEALSETQRRFRAIIDQTFQFIGMLTTDGTLVEVNETALAFSGVRREEVLGRPFWEGPWWRHSEALQAELRGAVARAARGEFIRMEVTHPAADGSLHNVDFSLKPIRDGAGEVVLLVPEGRDITERQRMQEALQQSERRLRLHVEQTPLAVIEWDAGFRVLRWNPGAERIFGHPAAEAIGRHASFIVPEQYRPMVDAVWSELIAGRGGERATNENVTRDGRTILCEWYNTPLVDAGGSVVGVTSLAQDVTMRREAEERFGRLVNRALVGVFRIAADGTALLANPAVLRIFGYDSMQEFNAAGGVTALYADLEDRARLFAALKEGPVNAMEIPFCRKDGTRILVAVTAILVRDEEGRSKYVEGTLEDVTQRRIAEQAVRDSEQKLAAIIDLLPDAAFIIDRDGKIAAWNKAIEELLGYGAAQMLGKGDHEYAIPFYGERRPILIDLVTVPSAELEAKYTSVRREGEVIIGEAHVRPPRGKGSYMLGRARALYDARGEYLGAVEIAHDLTERKRMEETLQQAKDVAERAARARSDFVANMSHEIRTPMNGIMGMLDLALTTDLGREQREYLELARSAADSLLVIIDDILDFSKIEAAKLDLEQIEFHLAELCDEILPLIGIDASRKGIELVCEMDPQVPDVLVGDPVRLKQVLVNLLKNAVKFTERGHILLRTEKRGAPEPGACEILFSVIDTGVGIPADKLGLIFDSFSQVDSSMTRRFGGTGLGLTISKSLVEMMGGAIWVDSALGAGSAFHFAVPFRTGGTAEPVRRLRLPELSGRRTLVIDDNGVNRRILRGYLESWEMAVDEAADGPEGLRKIRETGSPVAGYDLVLLDCVMPGFSGFEVAEELLARDRYAKPVILMLSSMEEKDSRRRCRDLGIARFLVKPVSPSTLYDAIVGAVGLSPAEIDGAATAAPAAADRIAFPGGVRILVAEDNAVNVEVVRRLLERVGLECDVAGNGAEALEALARERYDVVLMDIQMPVMDGMEATQRIRQLEKATGAHVPIVALTAHSMKGDRARFLAGGMDDYLAKPLDAARLYQAIARFTRGAVAGGEDGRRAPDGAPASRADLLDAEDLLERMGGDAALVVEVLRMFVDECDRGLDGVAGAVAAGDAKQVRSAAHYLKSMSLNVSAKALAEACREIEQLGAAGDAAGAAARLAALAALAQSTCAAIRAHLGGRS